MGPITNYLNVKKFVLLCWAVAVQNFVGAQNYVTVFNAQTNQPIQGVVLQAGSKVAQTNASGKASLDLFDEDERIVFRHSSFIEVVTTPNKLKRHEYRLQMVESPVKIDEVLVSVNRWSQTRAETPQTILVIPAEDAVRYSPQTAADLLSEEGGVFIQKSQMGGGSPMIRGFAANRVLIVVDGIRMNNALFRGGNLHNVISVDPNSLEHTEVILGPGSVLYGSDALGGVMSFSTCTPRLSTSEKPETSGTILSRYSSANNEHTVHGRYGLGSQKWAAVTAISYSDFGDLKMGAHGPDEYLQDQYVLPSERGTEDRVVDNGEPRIQKFTAYHQLNILGKFRYRPNSKFDVQLGLIHAQTGDVPRYDRLIQYSKDEPKYAQWFYGPQKWTLLLGKVQYLQGNRFFDRMSLLAAYQRFGESRNDRKLNNPALRQRTELLDVVSLNVDFGKRFDSKSDLFYGLEAVHNGVGSTGWLTNLVDRQTEAAASRYPDGSIYQSLAAYYSFKYKVSPRMVLQMGSRYSYTHLEGQFDTRFYDFPFRGFSLSNSAFNGNLGVVWHPSRFWQLNANASSGFRSPNIDDVAKVFDSEPGNVLVPNPDLKPEFARNLEVGFIRSFPKWAKVELTVFYTLLKDAMVRRDYNGLGVDSILYDGELSRVEALVNAESATIYGANMRVEYLMGTRFRTRHDVSFTAGEDSDRYPVRHVPPTFGSSHLIYETPLWFVDLYAKFNGRLDYDDLAPDEQNKPHLYAIGGDGLPYCPSWWTLNLKASCQLSPRTVLNAGIENLLDKRYRVYSSGIVAPGRNVLVSVQLKL